MNGYFYVAEYGYHYPNPERLTLEQARKELTERLEEAHMECRRRYKCGRKHRTTKDSGRVTMGDDLQSTIWRAFSIQPCR
jgi:hypothetical protein